jgi:hypothetical protein
MSGCDCVPWVFPAGICGITDRWDRDPTTSPDWGTADAHIEWFETVSGGGEINIADSVGRLFVPELTGTPADSALASGRLLDSRRAIRTALNATFTDWTAVVSPVSGGAFFTFSDHGFGFHIESSVATIPAGLAIHKLRLLASYPTTAQEAIDFSPQEGSTYAFRHEVEEGVEQRLYVDGVLTLTQDISAHTWAPASAIGFTLSSSGNGAPAPIPSFEVHVNDLDCTDTDGEPIAWCVPTYNQPVLDEDVGTGDGVTTQFTTRFPYLAASIEVYVGAILSEVDPTDPSAGILTLIDPAPLGAAVRVSYRMGVT